VTVLSSHFTFKTDHKSSLTGGFNTI